MGYFIYNTLVCITQYKKKWTFDHTAESAPLFQNVLFTGIRIRLSRTSAGHSSGSRIWPAAVHRSSVSVRGGTIATFRDTR